MAKVSIIVPTYNVEQYLEECLESLRRQTLHDIEIICIDDGATDGSPEILDRYARQDSRFIVIHKENGGYGKAMNVGLDRAAGEYIGIVEPDDFVSLTMFEDLYAVAKENLLDFVKADFYRFARNENSGNMSLTYNHLDKNGEYYNQLINPSETPYVTKFILNTWSGIYARDFIEKYHIRHNETPGASFQDNGFFWQTFMYARRCMFLDRPYYMNRRDNPNSSVNSREKVYCMNIEYDFIRDIFMQKGNEALWERFKGYYHFKRYHNYMFTLSRIGDAYKQEYTERIGKELKRAKELDELDLSLFTPAEQNKIQFLIKDPKAYYWKYVLYDGSKLTAEDVKNTVTFKIGAAVVYIPRKIMRMIKGKK
ncbi:MAG TPA: glycosyltransferase [Candidatus Scybalocola faecipullorum]|nr:glycosyltransferase [Candidatus Scybalocola faecipullorum]